MYFSVNFSEIEYDYTSYPSRPFRYVSNPLPINIPKAPTLKTFEIKKIDEDAYDFSFSMKEGLYNVLPRIIKGEAIGFVGLEISVPNSYPSHKKEVFLSQLTYKLALTFFTLNNFGFKNTIQSIEFKEPYNKPEDIIIKLQEKKEGG